MDELLINQTEGILPEDATGNKHYITVDISGRITDGWSDGPHPEREVEGAILLRENGGYQFRLWPDDVENPPLYTNDGIPLYRWDGTQVVERTPEEIEADRTEIPAPQVPSLEEDMMTMIVDHEARLAAVEEGVTL